MDWPALTFLAQNVQAHPFSICLKPKLEKCMPHGARGSAQTLGRCLSLPLLLGLSKPHPLGAPLWPQQLNVIGRSWRSALPEDSVAPASSFEDTGHLRPSQMQVPDFKDLMS